MAQNLTFTTSTIGTASRNFIDVTTWVASFPSDFRTGGGVHHHGDLFADSDITDTDVAMGPTAQNQVTRACGITLSNAPGEKPLWRPGSGGAPLRYLQIARGARVSGITFDGSLRNMSTSGVRGMVTFNEFGTGSEVIGFAKLYGCTIKNSNVNGITAGNATGALFRMESCQIYDNALSGLIMFDTSGGGARMGEARNCGFAFNGLWGIESFTKAPSSSRERINIPDSWFRSNPSGSVQRIDNPPQPSSFVVMDDQRFTDEGFVLNGTFAANVLENAIQAQFAFVNEAGRDFTPGSGSVLLGQGHIFGQEFDFNYPFDVNNARLNFDWGDRLDVGPIQSKTVAAIPVADEPDLAVKSKTSTTIVVTVSNVTGSDTVTFFQREKENFGDLWIQAGTRSGNGDFTYTGLTPEVDYNLQCKVDT